MVEYLPRRCKAESNPQPRCGRRLGFYFNRQSLKDLNKSSVLIWLKFLHNISRRLKKGREQMSGIIS